MKTRCHSFLSFLILIVLPSLAFAIADRTNGEGAQDCQALYKELIAQLSSSSLQNLEGAQLTSVKKGIQIISQLLETKGVPQDNLEIIEKHAEQLGFKLNDEIDIEKAEQFLKNAFPIFEVSLKDLRDFVPGKNVSNLLFDTCQRLVPIKIGEEVRSSVTIRFLPGQQREMGQKDKGAGWRPTRWGLPKLIHQLTSKQKQLKEKTPSSHGFRLVSIPSLNRNFLGYEEDSELRLVPLVPDRLFKNEKPLSANEVFLSLSWEAQNLDESPR